MSRMKRSFWKFSYSVFANVSYEMLILEGLFLSVYANVSYETLVLEDLFVSFCECLVETLILEGFPVSFVWNVHFRSFPSPFLRMSRTKCLFWKISFCPFLQMCRTKRSFWKISLLVFANLSYETFILADLFVSFCECLVRNAHFGKSLC